MQSINSKPIIIIGKMGVGKSTVLEILGSTYSTRSLQYERIITYTTRERRFGESPDAYHFISNEDFDDIAEIGQFAEYYETKLWGDRVQYGSMIQDYIPDTCREQDETCIKVIILDPSGMKKVLKILKPSNCTVVYLKAKDETLIERCEKRGTESEQEILSRLLEEDATFSGIEAYCDLVINCDHSNANEVANVIDRYVHYDLF